MYKAVFDSDTQLLVWWSPMNMIIMEKLAVARVDTMGAAWDNGWR